MFKNYLMTALRSFRRYKIHSIVTVFGLALGIACCLLILLFVRHELSFDKHFDHADRIVRLVREQSALSAGPMAPALSSDLAGIEYAARIDYNDDVLLTDNAGRVFEERVFFADSSIFDIFSFRFVRGEAQTALASIESLVLTESAAAKLFGASDPIGRTVLAQADEPIELRVSAVIEDLPQTSHFRFDYLTSFEQIATRSGRMDNWSTNWLYTYALVSPGSQLADLQAQLPAFFERQTGEARENFSFQPLLDIHLRSGRSFDIEPQGNLGLIWAFMAIALIVVVIASVNFTNLATARASQRMREIGMRKALGANRSQLVRQFLGEAILQTFLATVIGLGLAVILLPVLNDLAGLRIQAAPLFAASFQVWVWSGAAIVGVVAGFYPAVVLAGFRPITSLRSGDGQSMGNVSIRRGLLLFQFVASAFLLVVTIIVYRQVNFMQNLPLGFEKELTLVVPLEGIDLDTRGDLVREQLGSHPSVVGVTLTGSLPGDEVSDFLYRPEGWQNEDDLPGFDTYFVDEAFSTVLSVDLIDGRHLSRDMLSDQNAFLINESAARILTAEGDATWADPIGKKMEFMVPGSDGWYTLKTGEIVGIVADFHYRSLHEEIDPLILQPFTPALDKAFVKVAAGTLPQTIEHLREQVATFESGRPFEFFFLDTFLDGLYQNEQRIGRLLTSFAVLVLIIACLGLFGLAALSAEQRKKEIGIRKVLGARVAGLVGLFVKEYAILVVIASIIAAPISLFAASEWLNNFAYRVSSSVWVFFVTAVITLLVAATTVSFQAIKIALANPVNSLRHE